MRLPPLPAVLAALLLAGCTTTTPPPSEKAPAVPAVPATGRPVTPVTPTPTPAPADVRPATLKGSEESSTLLDSFTAFITAIDGKPIPGGRKGWSQSLPVPPGAHRISVEFNRGSFIGRTELTLEAKPGGAYELRQDNDAQVYGGHSFCDFWIVDLATGEKATAPKRAGLEKRKQ